MKKIKVTAFIICMLLLCSMITSCENVSMQDNTSSSSSETSEANAAKETEASLQYVGGEFTVAVTPEKQASFSSDENTDDIVALASIDRNKLLLDKCGITLKYKTVASESAVEEIDVAKKANAPYADILCLPGRTLSVLADGGYILNLLSSPEFNIEKDYINPQAAKSITGNNTLYMLYNSTTQYYDETWVVFYDKQLVSKTGLADPAEVVTSGQWTWDKFIAYSEAVAQKVMSKGSPDVVTDIFGYSSYNLNTELPLTIWESCGLNLLGDTYKQPVTFKADPSAINLNSKSLQNIYSNKSRFPIQGEDSVNAFTKGRLGFFIYKLGYSAALSQSGRDWGIVPLPKFNLEQKNYCSFVDPSACALSIPINAADTKKSIQVLNMLCASSKESMKNAVYNKYVNLFFTNNSSTVMLNAIMNSSYFDFAALYGSGMPKISAISTDIIVDFVSKKGSVYKYTNDTKASFEKYTAEKFK